VEAPRPTPSTLLWAPVDPCRGAAETARMLPECVKNAASVAADARLAVGVSTEGGLRMVCTREHNPGGLHREHMRGPIGAERYPTHARRHWQSMPQGGVLLGDQRTPSARPRQGASPSCTLGAASSSPELEDALPWLEACAARSRGGSVTRA